jgi:putative ABC transport system permease protein
MTAVVGISASSRADLDQELAKLGTNMLTVSPGNTMFGKRATLPDESVAMIKRIGPVQSVTATGVLSDTYAYRNDRIPAAQSGGLSVLAAKLDLLKTVTPASAATGQPPASCNSGCAKSQAKIPMIPAIGG